MLIVALEGPSYAGKSTAIRHLRRTALGTRAFFSDCYVEHISHRDDIPRPAPPLRLLNSAPSRGSWRSRPPESPRPPRAADAW
ncbi:hypothetical protein V6574_16390 [Streptomyces sp. SM1P]